MDILIWLLALLPILLALFLGIRVMRRRRVRPMMPPSEGGGSAGEREPRRPLVPVGSASEALPIPREERPPLDARGRRLERRAGRRHAGAA